MVQGAEKEKESSRDSLNPDSKMDVLKSEILRKRQLVEDRNLLVVRSLEVGALATEELSVCVGEGLGRGQRC